MHYRYEANLEHNDISFNVTIDARVRFSERYCMQQLILVSDLTARSTDMIRVIMDVDTGIDDAIAIITALQSPQIEILAITTVSGNVSARLAGLNTLGLLRMFVKHLVIPVMQGAARPLSKKMMQAEADIHGQKGIGDVK